MANWRKVRLGEICRFKYGEMPMKSDLTSEGYPVYSGYRHVGFSSRYHYPEPEIIVVARGVGGTGDIKMTPPFCFLTNLSIAILLETPEVFKRFLFYRLSATTLWELRTGSAQAQITIEHLKDFEVQFPPLPVQRRIAGILSAYDELMENSQRRIRILEAMARALYREWFVHFRFPDHEKLPRVASLLGNIPQGWKLGKLADVCRVIPGYAFKSRDWQFSGVPVVKIKNIQQDNTIDTENTDFVSDVVFQATPSKFVLGHGDILIAMTGATAGKIGKLRINDRFLLNQRVAKILPEDVFRSLVWCAISTEESKERFFRLADGAAQPNMSGSQIEGVEFICPPRRVAEVFSRLADPLLKQADTLYLKIQNLRQTRDLLLSRLLSGQVELNAKAA